METNYLIIALLILAVIVLVFWVITRNRKDRKDLEHKINTSELKPDAHKKDSV